MQVLSIISQFLGYTGDMKPGRPPRTSRSSFGARVCALREAAGLTQEQVAEQLGISQPSYALWERKEVALRPEQLTTLAHILGVRIEEVLDARSAIARRGGPVGRTKRVFERVSSLPRHQQQKILDVVDALVAQTSQRSAS